MRVRISSSSQLTQVFDYQALALIQKIIIDTDTLQKFKVSKLNNAGGDINKRWFIDYWEQHAQSERLIRKRIWLPIQPKNKKLRHELAQKLCFEIDKKLKNSGGSEITEEVVKIEAPVPIVEILNRAISNKVLRNKSIVSYSSHCNLFANFLSKNKLHKLSDIVPSTIADYIKSSSSLSVTTQKNIISTLKAVFSELVLLGEISANPFLNFKSRVQQNESDFNHPYSDYEKKLIEDYLKANNLPLYYFTRYLFFGFIRPNELIQLKVKDIDLRNRVIKVSGNIAKTKKSGVIPIIQPLMDVILESGCLYNPPEHYIFGQELIPSRIKCAYNKANGEHRQVLETLGIYRPKITVLYSWKHTGNIFAYLAGVDIKVIQQINRHSSLATTEIYLRKLGLFLDQKIYSASW